jgi:general secretion pathway protein B
MSYILDALKKADAERERRGVPSLSAQSATLADDERRSGRGAGLAIVAVLAALALGAWWWISRDHTAAPAAVVTTAPVPAPSPSVATIAAPAPAKAITAPPPVIVPPAPVVPPPTVAAVAPPAAGDRIPALAELSADQRRQVPPLNVSGAVYAPQAANRMVFINGQVLREGDAVAEGLVVERIGAKSSVLSLRGARFEIKH